MRQYVKRLLVVTLSLAALCPLQACTSALNEGAQAAQAFESTGTIAVSPYNRTIFSSSNF